MSGGGDWLIAPADAPEPSPDVAGLCRDFRDGLGEVLAGGPVSLYLLGALAFPRPAGWRADVDFHAVLAALLPDEARAAIRDLHRRLATRWPLGDELDGFYLLAADAGRPARPTCRVWGATDHAWALHRAHVHAGRFVLLHGADPRDILIEPSWAELEASLSAEMRYILNHPESGAFGVLNACRVLYSVRTGDVVVSKHQAARWGRAEMPTRSALLDAAVRWYTRSDTAADRRLLFTERAGFVASVVAATGLPHAS